MPKEIENPETGEMETVYTAEELQAKEAEIEAARAEAAEAKRISAEKTENFRKYNELSEEEKKSYDQNTLNLMRGIENLEKELIETKTTLSEKEKNERAATKTNALKGIHGDNDDLKKTVEDNYNLLSAMPETTPEEIYARATKAAQLSGISIQQVNPLYGSINGNPPAPKDQGEFTESARGQEAVELARKSLDIKKEA